MLFIVLERGVGHQLVITIAQLMASTMLEPLMAMFSIEGVVTLVNKLGV